MKVYLPATAELFSSWLTSQAISTAQAFAVTDRLRRLFADAGDEELEYHVLAEAGEASLLLAASSANAATESEAVPVRRLVMVAEVESVSEAPGEPAGAIATPDAIDWRRVTSLHVDDDDALAAVAAAVAAIQAGSAADALDEVSGYELMWFDVTEARDVLAMLVSR